MAPEPGVSEQVRRAGARPGVVAQAGQPASGVALGWQAGLRRRQGRGCGQPWRFSARPWCSPPRARGCCTCPPHPPTPPTHPHTHTHSLSPAPPTRLATLCAQQDEAEQTPLPFEPRRTPSISAALELAGGLHPEAPIAGAHAPSPGTTQKWGVYVSSRLGPPGRWPAVVGGLHTQGWRHRAGRQHAGQGCGWPVRPPVLPLEALQAAAQQAVILPATHFAPELEDSPCPPDLPPCRSSAAATRSSGLGGWTASAQPWLQTW